MHRTEVLCPECFKGKLLKEDSTKDTGSGYCDRCGTAFIFTGKLSVRYATAGDIKDQPKARVEEPKPKQKFYVTIMSIDPDIRDSEDPHQKYGYTIEATDKKEAEEIARQTFSEDYDDCPIAWVDISNGMPLRAMSA
jgi:hypothetical protein